MSHDNFSVFITQDFSFGRTTHAEAFVSNSGGNQKAAEAAETMIDLSFLTQEEQETILTVLNRDTELKKAEDKRVQ